LSSSLF